MQKHGYNWLKRFAVATALSTIVLTLASSSSFARPIHQISSPVPDTILLPFITDGLSNQSATEAREPNQHQKEEMFVARVTIQNAEDIGYLANNYDVWEEAISRQDYVTVHVSARDLAAIKEEGYAVEIDQALTASMQNAHHAHHAHADAEIFASAIDTIPGYACYRTVEETYRDLAQLAADNPNLATWVDIGDSWDKTAAGGPEGYDIQLLKLTNNDIPGPKPDLMIISAIHAREYTTAETNARFAEYLINNYGTDPDITWLLDHNEIHILPQANPDGRKIAEGGALWRKNRNTTNDCFFGAYGVDLNRNSSFQWGGIGSSANVCSQTYRGPSPESEPEVQAIQDYASSIFTDQRGPNVTDAAPATTEGVFITIHSYSELVLFPWGWTNDQAPNHDGMATLGRKFGYFNGYEICNDCLYIADGVTDDFTYGTFGVPSYTFELGTGFFQDCATFESTIYPDNLPALIYAAKAARRPYQTALGPDAFDLSVDSASVAAGTPVVLTATIDDTRTNSNGQGVEPTQAIQAARYSIDEPSWAGGATQLMTAADGLFDQKSEAATVTISTRDLAEGRHTIFVEGQDADGNWGVPTAIFLDVTDAPPAPITMLGDVDCDEDIDVIDALMILQYTVNQRSGVESCPLADSTSELIVSSADANSDREITAVDSLFILQCTVGLPNQLCPE